MNPVLIPLPSLRDTPPLTLNKQLQRMHRARLVTQVHDAVLPMARAARCPRGLERAHVILHWQPATNRNRDTDNPTPTLKAAIDALIRYGMCPDDNSRFVSSECRIEPVAALPRRFLLYGPGTITKVNARLWLSVTDLSPSPSGLLLGDRPTPPAAA